MPETTDRVKWVKTATILNTTIFMDFHIFFLYKT